MRNRSSQRSLYFIVLGNVFDSELDIHERYDIKGATYGRQTLNETANSSMDKNVALKDLDLIHNHERVFNIELSLKEKYIHHY